MVTEGDLPFMLHESIPKAIKTMPEANAYSITERDFVFEGNEKVYGAVYYQPMKI